MMGVVGRLTENLRSRSITVLKQEALPRLVLTALLLLAMPWISTFAEIPPSYYDSVDTSSSELLRQSLHAIIDDHDRHPYTSTKPDTWDILESADQDPANSGNILDVYRNMSITKQGGGNDFYNREHSWPKSYGFPNNIVSNSPYTDCHALFLSDSGYNSSRSNKPYRSCDETCNEKATEENGGSGGSTGEHPGQSNWTSGSHTTGTWETWVGRRGDVARALFYMDVRYEGGTHGGTNTAEPDLILTNNQSLIAASNTENNESVAHMGMLSILLEWHQEDPVDQKERDRNDAVFGFQETRNPFIDHPEWVTCVFANDCGTDGNGPVNVWINELHYDNSGADIGEFVEVAGNAGTDLTGWLLIGYNGATGSVYKTISLAGQIPDQQGNMGTVAFDFSGLQNGPADGLALVDANGQVIEFLSYEGSVAAVNGPAAGRAPVDIGISESGGTPVRHSIQRSGTGDAAAEFTWQPTASGTRGQPNSGQTFA